MLGERGPTPMMSTTAGVLCFKLLEGRAGEFLTARVYVREIAEYSAPP